MIPIIPVLDVMNGKVVRAIGGKRENYRPIVSKLTKSTEPIDVLKALIDATGSDVAYVADLDAFVSGNGPSPAVLDLLDKSSVKLWIDFGVRTALDLAAVPAHAVPVIGSETMESFDIVQSAMHRFQNVVGSVDCFSHKTIGRHHGVSPVSLAQQFMQQTIRDIIVLDLAAVGLGQNDSLDRVEQLLGIAEIVEAVSPECRVYAGGGIRNRDDLKRFEDAGCAGALVATALHDKTLA